MIAHWRHRFTTAIRRAANDCVGIVKVKAHLVHYAETHRRNIQIFIVLLYPLDQRDMQDLCRAIRFHRQREILHKLLIEVHCQP